MKAILVAAMMVAIGLAGCAGGEDTQENVIEEKVTNETFTLEAGKGALSGLVVDDRFRPIQLTKEETGVEYQAKGFVLLQEAGLQAQTNQNGEFSFVDLEPGRYTVRITAEGHESVPQRVDITEGIFEEETFNIRRKSSENSLIVTEDYTGFAACGIALGVTTIITNCIDTSGESDRRGTCIDFTHLNGTYMIAEARVDEVSSWLIQHDGGIGHLKIDNGLYTKRIYEHNGTYNEQNPGPWTNLEPVCSTIFFGGDIENPLPPVCDPIFNVCVNGQDFGIAIGKRVRLLYSIFIGEPDVDLETYELLTDDAS